MGRPPEPRELVPEQVSARELLVEAEMLRDEAAHVQRRSRLLKQMAAKLVSKAAEIVESQEDTTENGITSASTQ